MSKVRLATVWLDGCSGCHMSLLDMDEALIALAEKVDFVYSPLVDAKTFPADVDITLGRGRRQQRGRPAQDPGSPGAHEDAGFSRRLCGDSQCPLDAQSIWGERHP